MWLSRLRRSDQPSLPRKFFKQLMDKFGHETQDDTQADKGTERNGNELLYEYRRYSGGSRKKCKSD